jgi:type III pantothenate kinase
LPSTGPAVDVLLAMDVGNTETLIGLYSLSERDDAVLVGDEGAVGFGIATVEDAAQSRSGLTHHWRLATVPARTPDEHAVLLTQLLDLEGLDIGSSVTGIAVSSSVPRVTATIRQMAGRWFSALPCVVLGPGVRSGMPILYDNPKEVGADRVANAVGAYDLYGGPCVVVDLGTATTFDAVSAKGEYLGGAIAPGVAISLEALFEHAAALRRVEIVEPRNVIGRSTAESLESGVLYGFAAQVDGLCERFMEELGPAEVVATGGLSDLIAPHAKSIRHVEPWLTLHGLRIVYQRNVGDGSA